MLESTMGADEVMALLSERIKMLDGSKQQYLLKLLDKLERAQVLSEGGELNSETAPSSKQ